ncbi:formate dehydrogenase accessory sulfurtransferase FdhD [Lutimaribacter sp. EGI FJ00015]|uniref:Formate dehydrogenase accessory sulfurtransferase FdhD n=2 Tax=Lutimaribacter degradans TaxID=2945989 RepID=A0ACC5ZZQ0_9RHOB|nr:formate dehydrogenase accessory sulfurtransferase FdhD [Lutimaribacter sp. EGI FJ00013]MCM2563566.1 formate dehydrogenase accessory sulfurtransferase FdhD [Lutimaribacter sp. EGI FJ00013]MCO0614771.1 formate dehydrogenase accessory sulfurtransferase FdhD [Lutimaribacter sp. EGI FJ00015]MCO0637440.1 formate dehydrogenase accessory sulfurtransferase FdhD [Lutimaribacter sp. EGI FJ00014]
MTVRAHKSLAGVSVHPGGQHAIGRALPDEVPVALVFDGTTQAVMMASPDRIADFAHGFALSEGLIGGLDEVEGFEVIHHDRGIEARFWLASDRGAALKQRRRAMLGPVGCGLCGIDSLDAAMRDLPRLPDTGLHLTAHEVATATDALCAHQPLHDRTRATHAAGFLQPGMGITCAREDVGRHNALDKLIGALARQGTDPSTGAFVLTSRVSIDLVQKTVIAGAPVLIAVSAPTALAADTADSAGLTLAAFARGGGFDIFAHAHRIIDGA